MPTKTPLRHLYKISEEIPLDWWLHPSQKIFTVRQDHQILLLLFVYSISWPTVNQKASPGRPQYVINRKQFTR